MSVFAFKKRCVFFSLGALCLSLIMLGAGPVGPSWALSPQPGEALMPLENELPGWKKIKFKRFKPGGMHTGKR
jgi:hypothetical protein